MADTLLPRFKQIRLKVLDVTKALVEILDCQGILKEAPVRLRVQRMSTEMKTSLRFPVRVSAYKRLQLEHESFITDFTRLVSVVVEKLTKLEAMVGLNDRQLRVWVVWELFIVACYGWMKWINLGNANHWNPIPSQPVTFSRALSSLLAWLLSACRNHVCAWAGLGRIIDQLNVMLTATSSNIFNVLKSSPSPTAAAAWLSALPHDHISIMCCLVYEQLGERPGNPVTADMRSADPGAGHTPGRVSNRMIIKQLAGTIGMAVVVSVQTTSKTLLDSLSTPAVIACMQLEVVLQAEEGQLLAFENDPSCIVALTQLVANSSRLRQLEGSSCAATGSSGSKGSGPSSSDMITRVDKGTACASRLPFVQSAELVPRSTVSQRRLLRAFCGWGVPLDHPFALTHLRTMYVLLDSWGLECRASVQPSLHFCRTLATLAHHCSSRTLLWMQSFQPPEQRHDHTPRMRLTARQKQQQGELKGHVKVMFNQAVLIMVRKLMGIVTGICTQALFAEKTTGR